MVGIHRRGFTAGSSVFFFFIFFSFFLNASAFLSLLAEVGLPFYKLHAHDAMKKSSQMVSRFQEGMKTKGFLRHQKNGH